MSRFGSLHRAVMSILAVNCSWVVLISPSFMKVTWTSTCRCWRHRWHHAMQYKHQRVRHQWNKWSQKILWKKVTRWNKWKPKSFYFAFPFMQLSYPALSVDTMKHWCPQLHIIIQGGPFSLCVMHVILPMTIHDNLHLWLDSINVRHWISVLSLWSCAQSFCVIL